MRTYGRIFHGDGTWTWTEVDTDAQGYDDYVWITTLVQVLKLSPGESPFYANYGIPAQRALVQQVFPDYYVALTQAQFAPFFASLIISKVPAPDPTYNVNLTTNQGVKMALNIPV